MALDKRQCESKKSEDIKIVKKVTEGIFEIVELITYRKKVALLECGYVLYRLFIALVYCCPIGA
jgi:hypothetical protein